MRAGTVAFIITVLGLAIALGVVVNFCFQTNRQLDHANFVINAVANQERKDAYGAYIACLNGIQAYNVLREASNASSAPLRQDSACGPVIDPPVGG